VNITGAVSNIAVTCFSLVYADSKSFIQELKNGDVLDVGSLGSSISVRPKTNLSIVGSVVDSFRTENKPPYALHADIEGNYKPWAYKLGATTLRATPFTGASGNGDAGASQEITFIMEDSSIFRAPRVGGTKL
jgi:hypothetical protein